MGPGGTLRMVFEADAWDSTISFAPGIPVTLGGTLELTFAADVNLASQVGRTFDIFDWAGVNPTGALAISSPYTWDLSNLYTAGEVTLAAVPEPASVFLAIMGFGAFLRVRRSSSSSRRDAVKIAQQFTAGREEQPAAVVPEGRLRSVARHFNRPSGTHLHSCVRVPSDESLGYCQMSLRDNGEPNINAGPITACGGNDRKRSWICASYTATLRNRVTHSLRR
jgi:hypothetical protein